MKELKFPLIILVVVVVVILLVVFGILTENETADNFSLNLITEIVGIFLTVFLIDLVIKRRENKEKKNILKNTYTQYKRPAQTLLYFFAKVYKASTLERPSEWDTDYKTLFSTDQFYTSIRYLDFMKKAPVTPNTDWLNHSHHEMTEIKNGFDKILDKYAFTLDSKVISDLEWLSNNWIIKILYSGPIYKASDQSMDFKRENFCLLAIKSENSDNPVKELIDKVFEVAEYFESITDEKSDIQYFQSIWQENMSLQLSDSRVNAE
jgi:uncharacterized membrane protein YhaH (DUF805 family)